MPTPCRLLCWVLIALAAMPVAVGRGEGASFENTYAVIAGVLEWKDSHLGSFPKENRKDQALHKALLERGVPKENMVLLLDQDATAGRMWQALRQVARRAKADSTLLFYYAGHGTKSGSRAYFCNYDYVSGQAARSGFDVYAISDIIAANFRGKRVFLTADCCYSGTLIVPAKKLSEAGYQAVMLTSAAASNTSTSYWTFTQTMIDAVRGDPLLDYNGDGQVVLKEVAWDMHKAMKHCEMQLAGYANYAVPGDFPLAEVAGEVPEHGEIPEPYEFGQYVYAMPQGKWRKGRIFDHRDGQYQVRLQYYSERPTVWLPDEKIKPMEFPSYPVGSDLTVLWKKKEWKARVLKEVEGFHYITYPGYDSKWDEWVAVNRIVGPYDEVMRAPKVSVLWGNKWYPSVVLGRNGSKYKIHYTGEDTSWDEWVEAERIRDLPASWQVPTEDRKTQSKDTVELKRASCEGRYRKLLKKLEVPDDEKAYGKFHDYGYYDGDTWADYKDLPPGYWVYVAPHWYIWAEQTGADSRE